MPWCPGCDTEYIAGVEKCPDCGMVLREPPGLDVHIDEKDWAVAVSVHDPQVAIMIRDLLHSNGIGASIRDNQGALRHLYGDFPFFGGDVDIYVHKNDAEKAKSLAGEQAGWSEEELVEYMKSQGSLDDKNSDNEEYEDDET